MLLNLPVPQSKGELQCAVGLFTYYAKGIFNFSSKARQLHQGTAVVNTTRMRTT